MFQKRPFDRAISTNIYSECDENHSQRHKDTKEFS
jgi:hypothetical protein